MNALSRIMTRVYGDFLMRSRLPAYREFIESALEAGYHVTSLSGVWRRICTGELATEQRLLVLRHDVDTDPRTASAIFAINRQLGIEASFFFRLSTMAPGLMTDIAKAGSEASYHYEELSTVAKRRGLRDPASALAHLPEARERFAENIGILRDRTGLPMRVVAAHGDFVNRRLGIANTVVLDDPDFRKRVDIELDAYDARLLRFLPSRFTDTGYPRYWEPAHPADALAAGAPLVSVLTHPRHWRVARWTNALDDLQRVVEALRFDFSPKRDRRTRTDGQP